jgi:hypothetical protein
MKLVKVPGNKIINLDTVSSVGFKTADGGDTKTIFNYSHSITLKNGDMVADYSYVFYSENIDDVINGVIEAMGDNVFVSTNPYHYIINGDKVANIVFDSTRNRIIFNLSYSKEIKLTGGIYTISSDFCYWDFKSMKEYEENVQLINQKAKFIEIGGN